MKVVCISTVLTDAQLVAFGTSARAEGNMERFLTLGREYLVYGLEILIDGSDSPRGAYVWLVPDVGYLLPIRLAYFSISDPRVSRYWEVRQSATRLRVFPPLFLRDGFLDVLLTQDERSAVEVRGVLNDFEQLAHELNTEASEQ